jgi:hypothetical protein
VALWLALAYWTYQDAKRRIAAPPWRAAATALALFFPFLGPVLYVVLRPPEYLEDARERALEVAELEHRVAQFGERRSRDEVDRLLAAEGDAGDAALTEAVRRSGALTRADLADLDARLGEIETHLRRLDEAVHQQQSRAASVAPAPAPPAAPPPAEVPARAERERTRMAEEMELSRAERRAKLGLPPLDSDVERLDAESDGRPTVYDGLAPDSGETGRAQRPTGPSRRRRLTDPDTGSPYD